MAVAQMDPQAYPDITREEAAELGIEIPDMPAFQFGPAAWNYLYYAILGLSMTIGFVAFVNTGDLATGLIYFFFSLLGTAILGILFLSSVVIPLCVKEYERGVAAHKAAIRAAQVAAMERAKEERVANQEFAGRRSLTPPPTGLDEAFADVGTGPEAAKPEKAPVEDQASSLRRMVAAHQ